MGFLYWELESHRPAPHDSLPVTGPGLEASSDASVAVRGIEAEPRGKWSADPVRPENRCSQ